jgi:hypothetical protein
MKLTALDIRQKHSKSAMPRPTIARSRGVPRPGRDEFEEVVRETSPSRTTSSATGEIDEFRGGRKNAAGDMVTAQRTRDSRRRHEGGGADPHRAELQAEKIVPPPNRKLVQIIDDINVLKPSACSSRPRSRRHRGH